MSRSNRQALCRLLVTLAVTTLLALGFGNQPSKRDDFDSLYSWFSTLGYDAVLHGQFVKAPIPRTPKLP